MADQFDSRQGYVAQPSTVNPSVVQAPASWDLQAPGQNSVTELSHSSTTLLIKRDIAAKIFDASPEKYKIFRLLFDKPVDYSKGDEFTYLEKTFGRTALKSLAITATGTTVDVTVTAGTEAGALNKIIVYPDNTKAICYETTSGHVKLKPLTNGAANLPAVAINDYFSIQAALIADGQNFMTHYDRMAKIERYNYVQMMQRDKRWTRREIQKFINLGTTDYFVKDKQEQMQLLLQDMFCSFWNGTRGEATVTPLNGSGGAYKALTMGGIYPLMVAASCANSSGVTSSTLKEVFEALAFQTDYKSEGGVRYIFAQNALLYELSKVWKEVGIRYTPNDRIADLNLYQYKIGDMTFVPVATELFKELSMFPATWKHRLFVLDLDTIQPVCMEGYAPIETGSTDAKWENTGSINDYKEWWIQGMLSLKFNNPLSSFYIDTTGIVA